MNITSDSDYIDLVTLIAGSSQNTNYEPDYSFVYSEERHNKQGLLPKDGGTTMWYYEDYTIIKRHSLDGNRDVYIGIPEMRLKDI